MDIIINSLYSNKDVFIRELISNAADACDKKRFQTITAESNDGNELKIRVYPNRDRNTLTIEDNGIGMNKAEIIQNLGRIAESGRVTYKLSIYFSLINLYWGFQAHAGLLSKWRRKTRMQ